MNDQCPTCGAGRNEETDDLYARIAALEADLARRGQALETYAKSWEGVEAQRRYHPRANWVNDVLDRAVRIVNDWPVWMRRREFQTALPVDPGTGEPPAPPNTEQGRGDR